LLFIISHPAMACVGCGQTKLFSPKILAISMSFILLPSTIVTLIALKLRRDAKADAEETRRQSQQSAPSGV